MSDVLPVFAEVFQKWHYTRYLYFRSLWHLFLMTLLLNKFYKYSRVIDD